MRYPIASELTRRTFGSNVRAQRGNRTQAAVAAAAGFTQPYWSKIERGAAGDIPLGLVVHLAVVLNCSADDLVGYLDQTVAVARGERTAA